MEEADTWLHFRNEREMKKKKLNDARPNGSQATDLPRPWTCIDKTTIRGDDGGGGNTAQHQHGQFNCMNIWIALRCIYLSVHLHWCTYGAKQTSRLSWWSRRSLCQPRARLIPIQFAPPVTIAVLVRPSSSSYRNNDDDDPQRNSHQNGKNYYIKTRRERAWGETSGASAKKTLNLKWTIRFVLATIEIILHTHASNTIVLLVVVVIIHRRVHACKHQPYQRKYPSGIINN